jgi:hypothetical protein
LVPADRHPLKQDRKKNIASLKGSFDYLNNSLTGNCARPYDCTHELAVFKAVQVFDPSWATLHWMACARFPSCAASLQSSSTA